MAEQFEMSKAYQAILDKLKSPFLASLAYKSAYYLCRIKAERILYEKANMVEVREPLNILEQVYPKPASSYGEYNFQKHSGLALSVVVPCYNAEKTVQNTMLSIVNQKTDYSFEVIAVDDGSKDGTKDILQKLSEQHPKIKVISKENGGAGSARNAGLNLATGEYIMFCDADDVLLDGAIEALLKVAKKNGADLVQGSWKYLDGTTFRYKNGKCPTEDICEIIGVPWGKVIHRSLFKRVRYNEKYTSFEDSIIKCLILPLAKKVYLTDAVVYAWRRDSNGITNTSKNANRSMQAYWILEEMLKQYKKLGIRKPTCESMIFWQQLSSLAQRTAFFDPEIKHAIFQCVIRELHLPEDKASKTMPQAQRLMRCAVKNENEELFYYIGQHWSFLNTKRTPAKSKETSTLIRKVAWSVAPHLSKRLVKAES